MKGNTARPLPVRQWRRRKAGGPVSYTHLGVTLAVFLSWGTCAVSTRQGSLGELAFPQGWESMEIEIHLENGDAPRRDCPEPERLLAYLAALPAEELEILGQVADCLLYTSRCV